MSSISTVQWPASDEEALASVQDVDENANFVLDGDLINSNGIVQFHGYRRTISFTSVDDNSTASITVTGLLDNQPVVETITAPNNETVETTEVFDTVSSILVTDDPITNCSAGTGVTGATNWIKSSANASAYEIAVQVEVTAGTPRYDFQVTLDDVTQTSDPNVFNGIATMTNANGSLLANYEDPTNYYRINIRNTSNAAAALNVTFLQQGLR